jgi:hypothetical protein
MGKTHSQTWRQQSPPSRDPPRVSTRSASPPARAGPSAATSGEGMAFWRNGAPVAFLWSSDDQERYSAALATTGSQHRIALEQFWEMWEFSHQCILTTLPNPSQLKDDVMRWAARETSALLSLQGALPALVIHSPGDDTMDK